MRGVCVGLSFTILFPSQSKLSITNKTIPLYKGESETSTQILACRYDKDFVTNLQTVITESYSPSAMQANLCLDDHFFLKGLS